MKILFVYPNITQQTTPQVGISSLISILKEKHQVRLFDITYIQQQFWMQEYLDELRTYQPDLVMISSRSNEWRLVKIMAEIAFPIPVCVGGIHATISPEEVINTAKYVMRGESEETVREFIDKLERGKDVSDTPGMWVKHHGKVYQNDVRPLIQDLDTLPIPSWEIFNGAHFYGSYIRALFPDIECVGTFEASRGCPYFCTYCCNEYLKRLYNKKGNWNRKKSAHRVVKEIQEFKKLHPSCNFLYFVDETFMISPEWLSEFNRLHDKTPYVFMTRPEMVTEEKMKLVAESGGRAVSIGVENGNERFRRDVLHRNMTQEQIIKAFKIAKDCGLRTYSFNMVGLPYETESDIKNTIALNKVLKPDKAQFTVFYPFKGTQLYDVCKKEGYLKDGVENMVSYYGKSYLNLPNITNERLQYWVKRAEKELN